MKKSLTFVSLLLIGLLAFSTVQLTFGDFASAATGAANFLPNNFDSRVDTLNETILARSVAQFVTTELANYNYPNGCYYSYDSDCTVSRYRSILSTLQTYFDESIVFSKGHRGAQSDPLHIWLVDHDGNPLYDNYTPNDIYSVTSSENVVTFIWHCQTAMWYPVGSVPDENGDYYGMPYCWTHNPNMGEYNTTGDQVFLGWNDEVPKPPYPEQQGGSPQYEWWIVPNTYNYANVAAMFWYYMCDGDTVDEALDNIAPIIYLKSDFDLTDLHGWLMVLGNKNLELP